jgi:hypothetical protein
VPLSYLLYCHISRNDNSNIHGQQAAANIFQELVLSVHEANMTAIQKRGSERRIILYFGSC